jgi:hypothetical protein
MNDMCALSKFLSNGVQDGTWITIIYTQLHQSHISQNYFTVASNDCTNCVRRGSLGTLRPFLPFFVPLKEPTVDIRVDRVPCESVGASVPPARRAPA